METERLEALAGACRGERVEQTSGERRVPGAVGHGEGLPRDRAIAFERDGVEVLHGEGGVHYPAFLALERKHASHLLRSAKPHEDIYRAFEQDLGAAGDEILFFDDRQENIDTATAIGWRAHRIDPTAETAPQIESALTAHGVLLS